MSESVAAKKRARPDVEDVKQLEDAILRLLQKASRYTKSREITSSIRAQFVKLQQETLPGLHPFLSTMQGVVLAVSEATLDVKVASEQLQVALARVKAEVAAKDGNIHPASSPASGSPATSSAVDSGVSDAMTAAPLTSTPRRRRAAKMRSPSVDQPPAKSSTPRFEGVQRQPLFALYNRIATFAVALSTVVVGPCKANSGEALEMMAALIKDKDTALSAVSLFARVAVEKRNLKLPLCHV